MKSALTKLVAIISVAFIVFTATCRAEVESEDAIRINKIIANFATQLNVGTIALNWNAQPEVKTVRAFPDTKRTAAILATIWNLAKNDEQIFSRMQTNDYQVLMSMLTRIHAYTFLTNLTSRSDNDTLLKEYLDQEVADLKQVFARKNSVAAYMQARKIRDDRQAALLKDQKFAAELVKFRTGKESVTQSLANVTTMLAFLEACTANVELCIKMDSM